MATYLISDVNYAYLVNWKNQVGQNVQGYLPRTQSYSNFPVQNNPTHPVLSAPPQYPPIFPRPRVVVPFVEIVTGNHSSIWRCILSGLEASTDRATARTHHISFPGVCHLAAPFPKASLAVSGPAKSRKNAQNPPAPTP